METCEAERSPNRGLDMQYMAHFNKIRHERICTNGTARMGESTHDTSVP